jgi:ABC-type transport system substrate-binding protein
VRSVKGVFVMLVLGAALAFGVSACGGSSTSTVTTTQSQAPPTTPTTTATTSTPTTTTATSSSSTTTAAGPGSCGANQAFSQVSNTCVDINPSGNPCPKGQVPMADRPVCVSKND